MKSTKTIIGACLLALGSIGLASCAQDEDNAVIQENSNLLKIRTSIADTRGVITATTFQDGDEIGVCVTTPDGQAYAEHSLNIRATYHGGQWMLDRDVELTDMEAFVYAYYPYDKNAIDSIDINLSTATTPEQTDYLQGSCLGLNMENTTANIRFNHALARVTLSVTKGTGDVGEGHITAARIENGYMNIVAGTTVVGADYGDDILLEGRMSVRTGEISRKEVNAANPISMPVDYVLDSAEPCQIDFLVIPDEGEEPVITIDPGPDVYLTIDDVEYRFSLGRNLTWEAGQQYTYPITVNRVFIPESVYMGFNGDDGQPLYWATCNLGAGAPREDGGLYGWGDPTGTHTEQWAGEDYENYVEGKEAGLDFYGGADAPENIAGTELDIATAMWGENWRMPSATEFIQLMNNCEITEEKIEEPIGNGSVHIYRGYTFTSKINGNTIYFPHTDKRIGLMNLYSTTGPSYWTSSNYVDEAAFAFDFGNLDTYYEWGEIRWGVMKYEGLPIRPVTSNPE